MKPLIGADVHPLRSPLRGQRDSGRECGERCGELFHFHRVTAVGWSIRAGRPTVRLKPDTTEITPPKTLRSARGQQPHERIRRQIGERAHGDVGVERGAADADTAHAGRRAASIPAAASSTTMQRCGGRVKAAGRCLRNTWGSGFPAVTSSADTIGVEIPLQLAGLEHDLDVEPRRGRRDRPAASRPAAGARPTRSLPAAAASPAPRARAGGTPLPSPRRGARSARRPRRRRASRAGCDRSSARSWRETGRRSGRSPRRRSVSRQDCQ